MSAIGSVVDLGDVEGLLNADREGLLRAASMSGAHVRAVAAAVDEGVLERVEGPRPRTVVWVAGRGAALTAGRLVSGLLDGITAEPIVVVGGAPSWLGPLDVLVAAGDDPGDPALAAATALATKRGARTVVVAPYEGPLRDAAAGRAAVLAPRLPVNDSFGLCRYLAAGVAAVAAADAGLSVDVAAMADDLDAEALRSSAGRDVFTNPAKVLAERMSGRRVVLTGDSATMLTLAQHASATLFRLACEAAGAAGLAEVVAALRGGLPLARVDSLFHDEEIDGPPPDRLRVLALSGSAERAVVSARTAGLEDVDLVTAADYTAPADVGATVITPERQVAVLALRLEMAAVYLRLVRG